MTIAVWPLAFWVLVSPLTGSYCAWRSLRWLRRRHAAHRLLAHGLVRREHAGFGG